MFERYTEKARRVIFFARYEASQFGSPYIETEHLLLGILREDKALTNRLLHKHSSVEAIRRQIEAHTTIREKVATSVDLPLSNQCKRVLAYAAEEAEGLKHKHLGTEHLLMGLLREEDCFANQILKERGIELETVREELATAGPETSAFPIRKAGAAEGATLKGFYTDLTQKALNDELEPVVGHELEIDSVIEVLCRKERRNPMLLGPRGAGKTAIVEALAHRIAGGKVPAALAEMKVLALSTEVLGGWLKGRERFEDLAAWLGMVANSSNLILFVDGLRGSAAAQAKTSGQDLVGVLRFALQEAEPRCVGAATEEDYQQACAVNPLLDRAFRPLHVKPLDAARALEALKARKKRLEQFHEVALEDEALQCAVERACDYLKERLLPGKALELLDTAAATVKVQRDAEPIEVSEVRKKIAFVAHRLESATANHEFEKARFYSEEERKERENLAALRERFGLEDAAAPTVTRADVEQAILKLNSYPYRQ